MPDHQSYVGRFAPSPTGPLHMGSLVCAMASFLDARTHDGTWLVRIEDIDPPRDIPGADRDILNTLAGFGMTSDIDVVWQHDRFELYETALRSLQEKKLVYGCACTRSQIQAKNLELGLPAGVYPGTCRTIDNHKEIRAWRFLTNSEPVSFIDRISGLYTQNVERSVGDFVVKRADGLWAYQLAVVVDDENQGVTHIVRGADLLDNTPRQILLQRALDLRTPSYMHIPLVCDADGHKLSKQTKAKAVDASNPLPLLESAASFLGLPPTGADNIKAFWKCTQQTWAEKFSIPSESEQK